MRLISNCYNNSALSYLLCALGEERNKKLGQLYIARTIYLQVCLKVTYSNVRATASELWKDTRLIGECGSLVSCTQTDHRAYHDQQQCQTKTNEERSLIYSLRKATLLVNNKKNYA